MIRINAKNAQLIVLIVHLSKDHYNVYNVKINTISIYKTNAPNVPLIVRNAHIQPIYAIHANLTISYSKEAVYP